MKILNATIWRRPAILIAPLVLAALVFGVWATLTLEKPVSPKGYSIGDVAKQEIVAPGKLVVVDSVETENRRQVEAAKIPIVFRFQKNIAGQTVANFSTEFIFAREKFLDALEKTFKKRVVTTNEIATPRFRRLVASVRAETKTFPVNAEQAARWAQGNAEQELHKQLCEKLRATSTQIIRPDSVKGFTNTFQVRSFEWNEAQPQMSLEALKLQSQLLRRTNMVSLTKARTVLLAGFPIEERPLGRILTNFVSVNCFFEEELTRKSTAEKTNLIWAVNSYEPGEVIVQRGEVVTAKIKSALDELKIEVPAVAAVGPTTKTALWSAAIVCGALAFLIWLLSLALRPRTGLVRAQNILALPQTSNELEAKLIPHLARGLMNKFVRQILWQRSRLIEMQSGGTEQLNHLEKQLEQISTRLQTRQIAYEKRIADLERELAAAEEENRELIRAKIREARQNLEWEQLRASRGQ